MLHDEGQIDFVRVHFRQRAPLGQAAQAVVYGHGIVDDSPLGHGDGEDYSGHAPGRHLAVPSCSR